MADTSQTRDPISHNTARQFILWYAENPSNGMILALFHFPDHLIQFGNRSLEAQSL
jgi:hypothetical protein